MIKAAKTLSDFFNKKIFTTGEFMILSGFIALNPLIIVAIEFILGIQFLTGFVVACLMLLAIKTQWRKNNV